MYCFYKQVCFFFLIPIYHHKHILNFKFCLKFYGFVIWNISVLLQFECRRFILDFQLFKRKQKKKYEKRIAVNKTGLFPAVICYLGYSADLLDQICQSGPDKFYGSWVKIGSFACITITISLHINHLKMSCIFINKIISNMKKKIGTICGHWILKVK